MKLLKLFVLFAALSLLGSFNASATHVMGSDIQWKCIGDDTFTIQITVYRDCNGIQLSNGPFRLTSNCGTMNVNGNMSGGEDITPVCDEQCTRCDSRGCTFKYGIQKWVITGTVVLTQWRKNGCCEVTISWGQCCRNNAITTGGASNNFYVEAKLNLCQDPCDNSPQFTGDPLAIICLGRDFIYNQGATDPDVDSLGGLVDSLVYKFAEPLQSATQATTWSSPYSYDKPIYFLGFPKATKKFPQGLHLDVNTGDLMFRPMKEEQTVVSIAIEEYRNGVRIGITRRDIQIVVIKCPDNNPPVISGINCKEPKPENFKTTACAGEKLCFTVCTSDKDKDDTVTIGWNAGIPDATFDILNKGDRLEKGRFCWTPDESKVSKFPYTFVVTAKDNACPVNGFSARSFSITVKAPPKAKYEALVYNCGDAEFRAQKSGPINISQYLWGVSGRLIAKPGGAGDTSFHHYKYPGRKPYTLTLIGANGCNTIYEDTAEVPDYVNVTTSPNLTVCAGATVNVSGTVADAVGKYKLKWSTGDSSMNVGSSTSITVGDENTFVVAYVEDENCDNADTTFIIVNKPSKFDLGDAVRICPIDEHVFTPTITLDTTIVGLDTLYDADSIFTYAWYQNDLTNVISSFDSLTVKDSARYFLRVIDSLNCSTVDSVDLLVNPDRNWLPDDEIICINDTVEFKVKDTSPKSTFEWWMSPKDSANAAVATGESFEDTKATVSHFYGIRWTETLFGLTCTEYDSVFVKVNLLPEITLTKPNDVCENADDFSLVLNSKPLGGIWYDNDPDKDFVEFGKFYPERAGADGENPRSHKLFYEFTDNNKCVHTDSTLIIVRPLPVLELSFDSLKMCDTEDPRELDQYVVKEAGGRWTTNLNPSPGVVQVGSKYYFDSKAVGGIQGYYPLIYSYTNNTTPIPHCSNTDTLIMHLIAVPEVEAGVYDSICKDATPIRLTDNYPQGRSGEWFYMGTDNTAAPADWEARTDDQFDPNVLDVDRHYMVYRYTVPRSECSAQDTAIVDINPLPNPQSTTVWDIIDGENKICITDLKDLTGTTIEDGELYTDYFWSGRGSRETRPLTYQFDANSAGEGSSELTYTVTNIFGCNNRINETVVVDGSPVVAFANEKACVGDTVFLNVDVLNASELSWTTTGGGEFDGNSLNAYYLPAGDDLEDVEFTITATTVNAQNICPAGVSTEIVRVFPEAIVNFSRDSLVCGPSLVVFKDSSVLSSGSMREFAWDYGDGTEEAFRGRTTTFDHNYGVKGDSNTYFATLTVTTDQGCVSSKTKKVVTLQTPIAAFNPRPGTTTIIQPDIYFQNLTTRDIPGKSTFEWNFDDFGPRTPDGGSSRERHPSYRYNDVGEYDVMLVATNIYADLTCTDTIVRTIEVNPEIRIFIPNAFSPDNKGVEKNNVFMPIVTDVINYRIQVYSRWGELMWETSEVDESWNGQKGGVDCKSDAYLYVVKASNEAGKEFEFTGTVTLIR